MVFGFSAQAKEPSRRGSLVIFKLGGTTAASRELLYGFLHSASYEAARRGAKQGSGPLIVSMRSRGKTDGSW